MRKAYIRIKLPEQLVDYVAYVVERRLLGYRSMIEFVASATRKEVQRLRQLGFIPPVVPKVREVPAGAIGTVVVVLLVAMVGLWYAMPVSLTGMGVLDDVFSPLAGWDVGGAYERYQGFINFTLYFVAFLAILFSVAKRWLDRREAILLSSVLAIALSIGLAMVPTNLVYQLSPVALLVIVLVLFYLLLEALRRMGFAWISCGSLAYIFAYLLVRTHRPDLFARAGPFGTILNLAFLAAFFVAIIKIVSEALKRSEAVIMKVKHAARLAWGESFQSPDERALIKKEQEELGQLLRIEPVEYKALDHIERDIQNAETAIRKYGYSKEALESIARELAKLREQESEITKKIANLQALVERVKAIELDLFTRLKMAFDRLPAREQAKVRNVVEEKVAELNLEATLPRLAEAAIQAQGQVMEALTNAITDLEKNQPHDALGWLDRTRYYVAQLRQVLTQVKETEQAIQALLGRSLKYFQK